MRTVIGSSLLLLVLIGCQQPSAPLDAEDRRILDTVLTTALESTDIPGVVAVVTTRDSVLYRRAVGLMDPQTEAVMDSDAIFRIHSMTKPITSLALMMVMERGLVQLGDTAAVFAPALSARQVLVRIDTANGEIETRPPARPITLRDLLRHTADIGYMFSSPRLDLIARHFQLGGDALPLLHDPGQRWTYGSSTAYVGTIVERVSGQSLPEYFQSEIFAHLEMTDTSFDLGPEKMHRLVADVRRTDGELKVNPKPDSVVGFPRGDAGLLSTADDYARFVQLVLGGGERNGVRLVSEKAIDEMARDQLEGLTVTEQPIARAHLSRPFPAGAGRDGFGLGFQVTREASSGSRPAGSLSWGGLANTHFWIDRTNDLGVVLMFQVIPFYDEQVMSVVSSFEEALYDRILGARSS